MSQLMEDLLEVTHSPIAGHAIALLSNYSFDLGRYTPEQLVESWASTYPLNWVRLAVIESLYQGRYKAVSVEQILAFWQRRGRPLYHFGNDFERIICSRFSGADFTAEGMSDDHRDKPVAYSVRQSQQQQTQGMTRLPVGTRNFAGARIKCIKPWHTAEPSAPPFPPVRRLPVPTLERQLNALSQPAPATKPLLAGVRAASLPENRASEELEVNHAPIHQFVPTQSVSELDQKLRAVAHRQDEFSRLETTLAALRSRVNSSTAE